MLGQWVNILTHEYNIVSFIICSDSHLILPSWLSSKWIEGLHMIDGKLIYKDARKWYPRLTEVIPEHSVMADLPEYIWLSNHCNAQCSMVSIGLCPLLGSLSLQITPESCTMSNRCTTSVVWHYLLPDN